MTNQIVNELSADLITSLQAERMVLLSTVDFEHGTPSMSAISWVRAVDAQRIRFAVSQQSRIVTNIKQDPNIVLTLFAQATVYAIEAKATILEDGMQDVPIKLTCIEARVDAVRDVMFYGAKLTTEPQYEKTYPAAQAIKLDNQVFARMLQLP
ncbi:pyridoxamine 5'-phosphate oxidase family protein [Rubeoparvulum massiliense]|uniref:pyridoxamine 5'-phosphate oxidase family protein n=1 Tax=Rubeoparvulum massiliense TaxID=1631346 RepID=UPI00065DEE78|nr:pyridoxamine 5'-phosphate oxidase family protein [Rubeoparvulum massiliense]